MDCAPLGGKPATLDYDEVWLRLIGGKTSIQVVSGLVAEGHDADEVTRLVDEIRSRPAFREALRLANRNRKFAGLLQALGDLFARSGFSIERVRVTGEEFYERYFFNNRPVIVQGLMDGWRARSLWSPAYFRERFGAVEVEVVDNRDAQPYEDFDRRRRVMTMNDFVQQIERGQQHENLYLIARNRALALPGLESLWSDFTVPSGFLDNAGSKRGVSLWFGPAGTVTRLHHDTVNNLFGQVYGRKKIWLVPPFFTDLIDNDRGTFSKVDIDALGARGEASFGGIPILEAILEPGEFLFIPVGWWHRVEAIDVAISLACQSFHYNEPRIFWRDAVPQAI
jgi:hypothetical protein